MLKQNITDDMKSAMKSGDKLRLSTIRLLMSEIKNTEIAKKKELDNQEILEVISREIKRRVEASTQYEQGGRQDLVDKENNEAEILKEYLPPPLTDGELDTIISEAMARAGAVSIKDIGKVMAVVMPKVTGRADGGKVSAAVKERLKTED